MSRTRRTPLQRLAGLFLLAGLAACGTDDASLTADGFVLPPGDVQRGQVVFVELGCNRCHVVANLDLPAHTDAGELEIELGGKRAKIKDYGELLTSVVHPQHANSCSEFGNKAQRPVAGLSAAGHAVNTSL
jgi:hypothetical protein